MSDAVAITSIGFVSSVGVGANQSCAAARAGLNGLTALPGIAVLDEDSGEMLPLLGHLAAGGIAAGFSDVGRLLALSRLALDDLARNDGGAAKAPAPLLVAVGGDYYLREHLRRQLASAAASLPFPLEEIVEAESKRYKERVHQGFTTRLAKQVKVPLDAAASRVAFGEQAALAKILPHAIASLKRGECESIIVGGVDSLVDEQRIRQLADLQLVKKPVNDAGFFAGEAAAFVRLERAERARDAKAVLEQVESADDQLHRLSAELPLGDVLATVARAALGDADARALPGLIINGLNGDHWQSWDLGHALVRSSPALAAVPQWHPAESFGEIGAAMMPAMFCVAARAFDRSYARTDRILTCVNGNDGTKAAALLSRSHH